MKEGGGREYTWGSAAGRRAGWRGVAEVRPSWQAGRHAGMQACMHAGSVAGSDLLPVDDGASDNRIFVGWISRIFCIRHVRSTKPPHAGRSEGPVVRVSAHAQQEIQQPPGHNSCSSSTSHQNQFPPNHRSKLSEWHFFLPLQSFLLSFGLVGSSFLAFGCTLS